ncbi:hypothetical protein VIBNISO65_680061 [Vibrio nigripulchritudo SO65]|nr:hypothetical protein VIBNIAM115_1530061 [Vibrio nigripulchritudo AM115]CCN40560.1 hypothetical protein VIBNIFTn2_1340022 [Vibrio nigripulchritudo FTn2]CCN66146.1 hypothetical protein VIBNIPon4_50062 [Vibrio nigripulchritudo POn4]CCN78636.1 hypothetical protein VIBNISO65_680061 [Vibrio nigripulchritudo SO65]
MSLLEKYNVIYSNNDKMKSN